MADRLPDSARPLAVALARVVLPPGAWTPGGDERTVERLEALLCAFDPRALRGYAAMLHTLEHFPRPTHRGRRFSELPRDEAERFLVRLDDRQATRALTMGLTVPLKVAYFDDQLVYERFGATWGFGAPSEPERWREQITPGAAVDGDTELDCDVVVVGTGAGGGVIAKELTDQGHAVVMLEEGEYWGRETFTGRAVDAITRFYRDAGFTGAVGNTVIPIPMGRMVGGSTAINTGTCWRTPEWVLDKWATEWGLDQLSTDRLGPYFERVERELDVADADPHYLGGVANVIARGCDALGYRHRPLRRNAPGCDGAGVCNYGCPTGAKRSTNVSYVPAALRRGAGLFTGVRAERVILDHGGRAVGVEARSLATGKRLVVRAQATVLSCGTLLTPAVLQRQGLDGGLRHVGRNLSIHPAAGVSALFDEDIRGYSAIPQGYCVDEFRDRGILMMGASAPIDTAAGQYPFVGRQLVDLMEAYDRVASFGVMVEDRSRGRVRLGPGGRPIVLYWLGRRERDLLLEGTVALSRIFMAAGAKAVYPSVRGHDVITSVDDLARMAKAHPPARDWLLMAFHPLGTCRMATSPAAGVVGQDHQVFGRPGLYIVDGSVVPSSVAVNPQVTIMTFATRAADVLGERLQRSSAAA